MTGQRLLRCFSCALVLCCAAVQSVAETLGNVPEPGDDAAVWYLTAALDFPAKVDQIDLLLGRDDLPRDDASKLNAIESLGDTLWLIRRGAALDRCGWAVDIREQGPKARMMHLSVMRRHAELLSAVACFSVGREDARDQALSDFVAVLRMSRHIKSDGSLISCLVQLAIEDDMYGQLSTHLHRFDRGQLERLKAEIDNLPARWTIAQSIAAERLMVDWLIKQLDQKGVDGLLEATGMEGEVLKGIKPGNQKKVVAGWLDEMDALYQRLSGILALPYHEFKSASKEFTEELDQSQNTLAKMMLPSLGVAREREINVTIRREILRAMITCRLGGESAFEQVTDPIDGKPFDIERDGNMLIVNSRVINRHGIPVRSIFDPQAATKLD